MNRDEIFKQINQVSKYLYFDITYKGKHDFEMVKDTIKLSDLDDNYIKVCGVGFAYTLPLEKVLFISEPNDVCLRYRLRDEYRAMNNDDNRSLYLFNALTKLLGDQDKACAFIEAR